MDSTLRKHKLSCYEQGRRQKNFQGAGATGKRAKNSKKNTKNATIKPLSCYICIMYENPGGHGLPFSPVPTPMFMDVRKH